MPRKFRSRLRKRRRVVGHRRKRFFMAPQDIVIRTDIDLNTSVVDQGGDTGVSTDEFLSADYPKNPTPLVTGTPESINKNAMFTFQFDFSRIIMKYYRQLHEFQYIKIKKGTMGLTRIDSLAGTQIIALGAGYGVGNSPPLVNFSTAAVDRPARITLYYMFMPDDCDSYTSWNTSFIKSHHSIKHVNLYPGRTVRWKFHPVRRNVTMDTAMERIGPTSGGELAPALLYNFYPTGRRRKPYWIPTRMILPLVQSAIQDSTTSPIYVAGPSGAPSYGPQIGQQLFRIKSRPLILYFEFMSNPLPTGLVSTTPNCVSGNNAAGTSMYSVPVNVIEQYNFIAFKRYQYLYLRVSGSYQALDQEVDSLLPMVPYDTFPNGGGSSCSILEDRYAPLMIKTSIVPASATSAAAYTNVIGAGVEIQTEIQSNTMSLNQPAP